jgi:hypothetical protein
VLDLLDGAFAALRQRPRTLVAVVLPVLVPVQVLQAYLARDLLGGAGLAEVMADPTLAEEAAVAGPGATGMLADLLLNSFTVSVTGVAVAHVVAGWLEGREVTAGEALRAVARRWWVVLVAWAAVRVLQVVGLVLVPVVLLAVTSPVVAFEGRGPLASIRRSAALVRTRFGPAAGVVSLTALVSYGVSQAIGTLPSTVALVIGPGRAWPLLAATGIVTSLVLVPFVTAAAALLYLDLRFRAEGLDLELEAAEVLPRAR